MTTTGTATTQAAFATTQAAFATIQAAFATRYARAKAAHTAAVKALDTALIHVKPIDADLHNLLLARNPEGYARATRAVADILDTIPALRAEVERTAPIVDALYAHACHNCNGTGQYAGATGYHRNGVAYCFTCGGDGRTAAARKANR